MLASLAKLDLQQLDFQAGEVAKEPHEASTSNGSLPPSGETIVLVVAEGLQVSLPLAGVQPSAGPDVTHGIGASMRPFGMPQVGRELEESDVSHTWQNMD